MNNNPTSRGLGFSGSGGSGGTGNSSFIKPFVTEIGTQTYTVKDDATNTNINGTVYGLNFGNNPLQPPSATPDNGWTQSGATITFTNPVTQIVTVTGTYTKA